MSDNELLRWADKYKAENEHPQALPDEAEMVGRLVARIRELEAELERQRDLGADIAMGRKVIVPVEPTDAMLIAGLTVLDKSKNPSALFSREVADAYHAMIRAAQPNAKPQQGE